MNDKELLIDICSRLPYGLKIQYDKYTHDGSIKSLELNKNNAFEMYPVLIKQAKPILFHISYLTDEIQFRGEKIIPIIELAKIEGHLEKVTRLINEWGVRQIAVGRMRGLDLEFEFAFNPDNKSFTVTDSKGVTSYNVFNSLNLYDWLNSHMIDYRGLIDKGLTVSIWDLDENPYKFPQGLKRV